MTAFCEPRIDQQLDDDLSDGCFLRVPNDRDVEAGLPVAPLPAITAAVGATPALTIPGSDP